MTGQQPLAVGKSKAGGTTVFVGDSPHYLTYVSSTTIQTYQQDETRQESLARQQRGREEAVVHGGDT